MAELNLSDDLAARIKNKLEFLYDNQSKEYFDKILELMTEYKPQIEQQDRKDWVDEEDLILITYGDNIQEEDKAPLQSLKEFVDDYFSNLVSGIHILPFFPYSSDDGFSIIDYKAVNPEFGDWSDINQISEDYRMMFDAVINHISAESDWVEGYLNGEDEYEDFFIDVDPEIDLSQVTRPRAKPLLTEFESSEGTKHLWTTFSPDQVDLNFSNPEVLLRVIEILLFYVTQGAEIIRLDAIAYLWKKIGTSCIHLEETHQVVKLMKDIFAAVAPEVIIITETNVPHEENISYFGNGDDEAQMVYQFSLPPLVLHSFVSGDASYLSEWAADIEAPSEETTFFNFLASHDGIGVRPAEGILTEEEIQDLADRAVEHGGAVNYKTNSDGSKSPYELNITYVDAIIDEDEDLDTQAKKFVASQSILLAMVGVPGIYIHSLLGSRNYEQGVEETGRNRTINREKLKREQVEEELNDPHTLRSKVYKEYSKLIELRKEEKAFHPNGKQEVLDTNEAVFSLLRSHEEEALLSLHNVSGEEQKVVVDLAEYGMGDREEFKDIIAEEEVDVQGKQVRLNLAPYQVRWLK
ncbi:alpha-amylase family glycosyl hydrolase [Halanaerobacter jeridensis]|uniref:Sucrose 6(F)-phosphate phosphorylase n=1 Tax=Halanaerobacter jeridensis TaxID=706427 RepID=A0A938XUA7_9FIRM|nr:alpha-amylase family glycosyl hydrolase [Halanaerobacter jeridensis]MBM7557029.1 sucrose phosphorylase [Halanaerobacter jeridensis]